MLMVIFRIGTTRYALESQKITEIVPLVMLNPIPQAPEAVAGVFNYRGQVVPVIDLGQLLGHQPCATHSSTRIILVNAEKDASKDSDASSQVVGLIAEQVTETLRASTLKQVDSGVQLGTASYLGSMMMDDQGMIQLLCLEGLLSMIHRSSQIHDDAMLALMSKTPVSL